MQAPQERRRTAWKLGCPGSPPGQPESDRHRSRGGSGTCGHGAGGEPGAPPAGSNRRLLGRQDRAAHLSPGAGRTTWASLTEANTPCEALAPGFPTDPTSSRLCWGRPSPGSVPADNQHTDPSGAWGSCFRKEAAFSAGILSGFEPPLGPLCKGENAANASRVSCQARAGCHGRPPWGGALAVRPPRHHGLTQPTAALHLQALHKVRADDGPQHGQNPRPTGPAPAAAPIQPAGPRAAPSSRRSSRADRQSHPGRPTTGNRKPLRTDP